MWSNAFKTLIHFSRSIAVILTFLFLGKALNQLTGLPIPGSIWGLLLLFTCLSLRIIPLKLVQPSTNLLLSYITLFFVPVGVGLLEHLQLLSNHWPVIVISSLVSTFIVLICVGKLYQYLIKGNHNDL
ncbi:hydrogenase [Alteromonadales bacterium alter-6D02]|nr:hydrogenase [Alteromonadales bacterium alter-6D02]